MAGAGTPSVDLDGAGPQLRVVSTPTVPFYILEIDSRFGVFPCLADRCWSPIACEAFGYCRWKNFSSAAPQSFSGGRRRREDPPGSRLSCVSSFRAVPCLPDGPLVELCSMRQLGPWSPRNSMGSGGHFHSVNDVLAERANAVPDRLSPKLNLDFPAALHAPNLHEDSGKCLSEKPRTARQQRAGTSSEPSRETSGDHQ